MGSESIAHEAEGKSIQLASQKNIESKQKQNKTPEIGHLGI